jgi:hypothetical protein
MIKRPYINNIYIPEFNPSPEFRYWMHHFAHLYGKPPIMLPLSMIRVVERWCDKHILYDDSIAFDEKTKRGSHVAVSLEFLYREYDPDCPANNIIYDHFQKVVIDKYYDYIIHVDIDGKKIPCINKHMHIQLPTKSEK